jgi:uncharacterized protein (TIGR02679 family)
MSASEAEIRALLGSDELRPFFAAVRRRVERGAATARSTTVRGLTQPQREAAAALLGWPAPPRGPLRIDLDELDRALRASRLDAGLLEVLEALDGPLRDLPAERAAEKGTVERMWERAVSHPAVQDRPELLRWIEGLRARGLVRRAATCAGNGTTEHALLDAALRVVARLPEGGVPLAVLAAEETGDAHALDPDRPLCRLVLRAAAQLAGIGTVPSSTAGRRWLWTEVGVLCDALSSHVLVLGLRAAGEPLVAALLELCVDAGEPVRLTLRQLLRGTLTVPRGLEVFVCENPSVVAVAADRIGSGCPPLVCLEGIASTAAERLLQGLCRSGARLRFHCDFDWGGLRIGGQLAARHGGRPWRFGSEDYLRAVAQAGTRQPLSGRPVTASWDASLALAMHREGQAIYEEQVVEQLVGDLERALR